jgi:hypothetical protein
MRKDIILLNSSRDDKKYMAIVDNKKIHFGLFGILKNITSTCFTSSV